MGQLRITEPALLLRIAKLYRDHMSEQALYEATRGVWKLARRRDAVQYAFAVAKGVVKEVFVVNQWHPAGTTEYATRKTEGFKVTGRWEFIGSVAPPQVRKKYVGQSVAHYWPRGASNPVLYVNVPEN